MQIKKLRTLDAIIEDSFKFFKTHAKEILKIIWEQNSLIIIGLLVSYFLYYYFYFGALNQFLNIESGKDAFASNLFSVKFAVVMIAMFIFSILFFPRFFAAVTGYMYLYDQHKGAVKPTEVKKIVNQKFWRLIGLTIIIILLLSLLLLVAILIMTFLSKLGAAGIFLALALGLPLILYLIVYISLVYYVYFFENVGILVALLRSYLYLKQRFWFSFGVIFIMGIIVTLIGAVFNAPVSIYAMIKTMGIVKSSGLNEFTNPQGDAVVAFLGILSYIGQLILRILTIISMVFLYYSLREYHTDENIYETIEQIGQNDEANQ